MTCFRQSLQLLVTFIVSYVWWFGRLSSMLKYMLSFWCTGNLTVGAEGNEMYNPSFVKMEMYRNLRLESQLFLTYQTFSPNC